MSLSLVLFAANALAHGGVLTGTVVDGATERALPRVLVTVSSPALQGERTVVTDEAGVWAVHQLPVGAFGLRFTLAGFEPRTASVVRLSAGATLRFDVKLEAVGRAPSAGELAAPTVDVGRAATGVNLSKDFVAHVPFVLPARTGQRSAEALVGAAPQTIADAYGFGVSGAQSPEHLYLLDGVRTNDPAFGPNGASVPVDFVADVAVLTGAASAEVGRTSGGVLSVVTKSGSNQVRGSVWGTWSPGFLADRGPTLTNRASSLSFKTEPWNLGDLGLEVGGPIVKDRLWFHVGVSPSMQRVRTTRTARAFLLDEAGTDYARDEFGQPRSQELTDLRRTRFEDSRALSYTGKLTLKLAENHTLSFGTVGTAAEHLVPFAFEPNRLSGQVDTGWTNTTALTYAGRFLDQHVLVDAMLGWHHQERAMRPAAGASGAAATTPAIELRRESVPDGVSGYTLADLEPLSAESAALCDPKGFSTSRFVTVEGQRRSLLRCPVTGMGQTYTVGGAGLLESAALDRLQATAQLTVLGRLLGHHTAKLGVDFEWQRYDVERALSGGAWLAENATGTRVDDARRFGFLAGPDEPVTLPRVRVTPTGFNLAAYVQDSWSVLDRVTLNVGLRSETQALFTGDGRPGLSLPFSLSPRLGLAYDFTRQGKGKLFAHYARYYETLPLSVADRVLTGQPQVRSARQAAPGNGAPGCDVKDPSQYAKECLDDANRTALSGSADVDVNRGTNSTGTGPLAVDPALVAQSQDELVFGLEYELFWGARLGVSYTRRFLVDVIETLSVDEGATSFLGNPGRGLAEGFPKATRDYDAVTVAFSKVFSAGWLATGSYTWSSLRGNYSGLFVPETGQLEPNANADFERRSQLANRSGPLDGDRTHLLKLFVAKEFALNRRFSLSVGAGYVGESGRPINYLAGHPLAGPDETFVLPRGAGGRTPFVHTVNAKVTGTYRFDELRALSLSVDVFNLFNLQVPTAVDQTLSTKDILPLSPASVPAGKTAQEFACLAGPSPCTSALVKAGEGDGTALGPRRVTGSDLNSTFKQPVAYQLPISVRLGVKLSF